MGKYSLEKVNEIIDQFFGGNFVTMQGLTDRCRL
jgi:hypothetical protein